MEEVKTMKKINMRKIILLGFAIAFCFSIFSFRDIYATEEVKNNIKDEQTQKKEIRETKKILDSQFSDLSETDLVLELEDGGVITGPGDFEVFDLNNPNVVIEKYNVQTDPKSISVKEYKEKKLEKIIAKENDTDLKVNIRGVGIPQKNMRLGFDQVYRSNIFSGSGWRTGGYLFAPAELTGRYLRWSTYVDTGNVCIKLDPYNISCKPMDQKDKYYWFPSGYEGNVNFQFRWSFYQTYNPIYGTFYIVANKD